VKKRKGKGREKKKKKEEGNGGHLTVDYHFTCDLLPTFKPYVLNSREKKRGGREKKKRKRKLYPWGGEKRGKGTGPRLVDCSTIIETEPEERGGGVQGRLQKKKGKGKGKRPTNVRGSTTLSRRGSGGAAKGKEKGKEKGAERKKKGTALAETRGEYSCL